jgi:hypothetical protein
VGAIAYGMTRQLHRNIYLVEITLFDFLSENSVLVVHPVGTGSLGRI